MCREDFRSESVDAGNESRDIALALRVIHTSLPRGGVRGYATIVYVCTASCQVPSRTTNNRKCSHNNTDMRRCSRMRARAELSLVLHARHADATQISSAITQNANRARKRGPPPFCHPAVPFVFVRPSRSENRSDPWHAHHGPYELY